MEYTVRLTNPEMEPVEFLCRDDVFVFRAATDAGYILNTACERGGCGACRAKVITGKVHYPRKVSQKWRINPETGRKDFIHLCSVMPKSDVTLETLRPWNPAGVPSLLALVTD